MVFDPENPVVKLCAEGMMQEGAGNPEAAAAFFRKAWELSASDFEKFTAAHYVARHQSTVQQKLEWDKVALHHALLLDDPGMKGVFSSLYLNLAKGYEDLGESKQACIHYQLAASHAGALPDDGYGQMIRKGIKAGLDRLEN